jgi:hypothetical protein
MNFQFFLITYHITNFTDKKTRNKAIKLSLLNVLLFVIVYYAISNYTKIKKLEAIQNSSIKHSERVNVKANKKTSMDKASNHQISKIINDSSTKLITTVNTKNIYKIKSNNPIGFYVLVGSFLNITNAFNKQKKNPTPFSCYVFEDSNNYNRVGLLVSENDRNEAEKLLFKFKKMQTDSWLVYNEGL